MFEVHLQLLYFDASSDSFVGIFSQSEQSEALSISGGEVGSFSFFFLLVEARAHRRCSLAWSFWSLKICLLISSTLRFATTIWRRSTSAFFNRISSSTRSIRPCSRRIHVVRLWPPSLHRLQRCFGSIVYTCSSITKETKVTLWQMDCLEPYAWHDDARYQRWQHVSTVSVSASSLPIQTNEQTHMIKLGEKRSGPNRLFDPPTLKIAQTNLRFIWPLDRPDLLAPEGGTVIRLYHSPPPPSKVHITPLAPSPMLNQSNKRITHNKRRIVKYCNSG